MENNIFHIKKILFISNSGNIGGAQKCLLDLILRLPTTIKPIIILPKEGTFLNIIRDNDIEYYVIPFRGWWYSKFRIKLIERAFNNLISLFKIYIIVKKLNINLVYTNTLYSPIGAILSRILKVSHIWHIHEFPHLNKIQKFDYGLKWSMNFVNNYSSEIICPSKALKESLLYFIPEHKIHCINNGININEINSTLNSKSINLINNPVISILIIGSIIEFKGQHDAIQVINNLKKNNFNINLKILGDGDKMYVNELKNLVKELGVEEYITWLGFRNNVSEYLQNADLLFVCSKYETFGMVIIEAMSVGCPVIATRTGGIPEIITHGFNGLLYEVGNLKDLTDKTISIIENQNLYSMISKNAIETASNYYNVEKYSRRIFKRINLNISKIF